MLNETRESLGHSVIAPWALSLYQSIVFRALGIFQDNTEPRLIDLEASSPIGIQHELDTAKYISVPLVFLSTLHHEGLILSANSRARSNAEPEPALAGRLLYCYHLTSSY